MQTVDQKVTEVLSKFKLAMKHYNISTIDGYFKMDKDNNFVISVAEFGETLKQIDPTISAYEIQIAYDRFDINKSGTLDFSEFTATMDKIQLPENKPYVPKEELQQQQQNITQKQLEDLQKQEMNIRTMAELSLNKLKQAVIYYNIDVASLFRKYDTTRDGLLDINEFGKLIVQMEPNLEITDILSAFSMLDKDRSYTVTMQEFMDACRS